MQQRQNYYRGFIPSDEKEKKKKQTLKWKAKWKMNALAGQ